VSYHGKQTASVLTKLERYEQRMESTASLCGPD